VAQEDHRDAYIETFLILAKVKTYLTLNADIYIYIYIYSSNDFTSVFKFSHTKEVISFLRVLQKCLIFQLLQTKYKIHDFKVSPCSESCVFSFGFSLCQVHLQRLDEEYS
jgi:hypothetical protein